MSTMTITVLETATIFEAEETIYRYDLPGTGIVEGWATAGVVEQAQSQLPDWPDAEITIDADDDVVALLSEAFTGQSVASAPAEVEPEALKPEEEPALSCEETSWLQWGNLALYGAMALVMIIIGAIAWWAVGNSTPADPEPSVTEIYTHGVMDFVLPPGYQAEATGADSVTLTGSDPALRILVATDPLNDASDTAIFTELTHMIDADPALEKAAALSAGRSQELGYLERPADGSEVWWVVWVENRHMVSFGCHSKAGAPNVPQRATCREIAQAASIRG